jgi:hypothetical protein
LKRIRNSTELSHNEINDQRSRLKKRLKATDRVIAEVLKPGKVVKDNDGNEVEQPGYKTDFRRLKLAADIAVDINKGLGVLRESPETGKESTEDKRQIVIKQLNIANQYGGAIPTEIKTDYEIIDDNGPDVKDTEHIDAHAGAPVDVKDMPGMDVSDNNTQTSDKQPSNSPDDKDADDA